jgi:ATPase subunit of ABC transporter with duplicated ATPase domains
MLAKLLLQKPALLMLDEPTNHLDLPSIEWVENYLNNYEGAIIVVSHDRQFLDNVSETIVEVSALKLNVYSGNYSFYLKKRPCATKFSGAPTKTSRPRSADRTVHRTVPLQGHQGPAGAVAGEVPRTHGRGRRGD